MKRMLFNATQQEELRVAIVDGQKLIDIDIETAGREQRKSNIYKGVITRIEPSLEACFVNYGEDRHGFLPFKEVARSYFKEGVDVRNASIKEALREGQEIMVQVEKEERGNKGAALTSFISLAGRYLVLMPNNPRGGGVSRRVEGEDRQELRETMDKLDLPTGMSVIARTAGIGRNVEELQWDLNYLMQLWRAIEGAGTSSPGAFLIYQESSLVIRAIRDYFQPDIGEILIDTDEIYDQAHQFMTHVMPDMMHRVKRYRDDVPLFSRFQIEHQIETAYSRTVPLPSGGAIVIDHTEALVSVDVNSARATRGSDIETTAFNTNLEAAEEVARQLRLRDLGGLIVIDFIDMENSKNQREVETRLKDALHYDRARVQMGKISRFGLMELSRQRLRPSLSEGSHVTCPRCNGTGHIRDTESSALQVLRIIQEEAMKENSAAIHVQAPVDVAAFLLNEKRGEILKIETRHRVTVILIPNKHLETPHYKMERIKLDDPRLEDVQASYAMAEEADTDIGYSKRQKEDVKPRQEAMVKGITPAQPAPVVERKPAEAAAPAPQPAILSGEPGFLGKLFGFFFKKPEPVAAPAAPVESKPEQARERSNDRNGRGGQRGRGRGGRGPREDREGARNEPRQEGAARQAGTDAAAPAARQPRPPREGQEGRRERGERTDRAERGERTEAGERPERVERPERAERPERSERGERQQRGRQERKEAPVKAEEPVVEAAALPLTAAVPAASEAIRVTSAEEPVEALAEGSAPETEAGEQSEEQRRRRRRRGGRNRNRREREGGEGLDGEGAVEAGEAEGVAQAEAAVGVDASVSSAAAAEASAPAVEVAIPAPAVEQTAPASPPAELATPAAIAPVTSVAQQITLPLEAAAPEVVATPAVAAVPELAAAPEAIAAPAAQASVAEVAAPVPVVPAAPAAPIAAKAAPAIRAAAPLRLDDLQSVLSAAGLTLASTDPDKLRAAQEAAAKIVPPARVPRERKPLPPLSTEPLVQVETRL
ncbi:Rne/Rng family ribonuclease [Janthinobacterium sp. 17J80-10]|uniref:Rne/Rng family ribonuclease n=1 Tax=Janthinobacterium sp. 17J80-10 TaxID=2497863 RepID=UPI0010058898|nr:Rne/Rng family ribonuclease [Janthinobacterium sp. 17J80-10]QAU34235.1 Rne/Rng family ribonuclease [Janthinobacterium sp. 17J80-10]